MALGDVLLGCGKKYVHKVLGGCPILPDQPALAVFCCSRAIASKMPTEDKYHYDTESTKCSAIIREEYIAYTRRLKNELAKLPRNRKQWWQINRELMNNTKPQATIPPLKFGKNWLSEPQSKADCLAQVFSDKCKIPAADGDPAILAAPVVMNDFVPIRRQHVIRVIQARQWAATKFQRNL